MELFFLALLFLIMMYALGSGYPVAFALPGAAILTIVIAGVTGYALTGDSGAYFIQDGPIEWLTAGVTNFRGIYWEVERDTLIAIPLFIFMGIMLQRSRIAEDLLVTMAQLFRPDPRRARDFGCLCRRPAGCHDRDCRRHCRCHGADLIACHAAEQLLETAGDGDHLCFRHTGSDHPAIDRADHSC